MLLLGGQVVSTVGTRVSAIAFPLLVLAQTRSPAKAGVVGFAQTLPYLLFFLPAGALVDRWDLKRVMLVAGAGRALAVASNTACVIGPVLPDPPLGRFILGVSRILPLAADARSHAPTSLRLFFVR